MSDPAQTNLTDRMIARLEEANKRSYRQLKDTDRSSPSALQNVGRHLSEQQPAQKRRLSRASLWFIALVGLVLAASVSVKAFSWEPSFVDATKSIIARLADASILPQPSRRIDAAQEPVIALELERRLQRMADELADAQRRIEQLKAGQDEATRNNAMLAERFEVGQKQMARDNGKVVDELNAAVRRMARGEEAAAMQLKTTELADAQRRIEQLEAGQIELNRRSAMLAEQFKMGQEQMARDNAKATDQLNEAVVRMAQRDVTIAEQLRFTQNQLADATSSRSTKPARKPVRRKRAPSSRTRHG